MKRISNGNGMGHGNWVVRSRVLFTMIYVSVYGVPYEYWSVCIFDVRDVGSQIKIPPYTGINRQSSREWKTESSLCRAQGSVASIEGRVHQFLYWWIRWPIHE